MLHPIFSILINRPDLVADHTAAYAELIRQEAGEFGAQWLRRAIAWVVVALGAMTFLILGGVSLMLGSVHPFHWVLVLVPGLALILTLWAFSMTRSPDTLIDFPNLRFQIDSDLKALREAAK